MNMHDPDASHDDFDADDFEDGGDDPDESLLMEFLDHWEHASEAGDQNAILDEYCARHPRLEGDFRGLAEVRGGIGRVAFVASQEEVDPDQLGPYRILRLLGYGGMGKVYEAEDTTLARRVAVKTIRLGKSADPRLLGQFKAERNALALLHNTNIVPIFSAGEQDGLLYFAMPLIDGLSLADLVETISRTGSSRPKPETSPSSWADLLRLAKSEASHRHTLQRMSARLGVRLTRDTPPGPSPSRNPQAPKPSPAPHPPDYERRVAEIVAVAADAIHSAHEAGVLHLDVKPSNILIEPVSKIGSMSLHPWLIDFGLANLAEPRGDGGVPPGSEDRDRQTRGFGTKGFMAPEMIVLRDANPDEAASGSAVRPPIARATDIWSLGVTLYQLLTLHLPFSSDLQTVGLEAPVAPRRLVPTISAELEAVVLKALQKRPEQRYATAADFAKDLRNWLAGIPTVAGKASLLDRVIMWARRRPAAAFAAGMTAAFVIASLLGAVQNVRGNRIAIQAVEKDLKAKKRALDLSSVEGLRAPIRAQGWFDSAWAKIREIASSGPDEDGRLQRLIPALLEHIDVRRAKSFAIDAEMLAFSPDGTRLMMGQFHRNQKKGSSTSVMIGDLAGQAGPVEKRFESFGIVGFGPKAKARYLELDPADRSRLRLRDASTGAEILLLKSPKNGVSTIIAHALARDGSHAAGIVWPLRKRTPEELAANPGNSAAMTTDGDTATLVVWNLATGEIVYSVDEKQTPSFDLVLSPDGTLLATWDTTGRYHEVAAWSVKDKAPIDRFSSRRGSITNVAFGPDPVWSDDGNGQRWRLAIGEKGGMTTVWNLKTRAVQSQARGTTYDVKTIDFNADGTLMASAGRDQVRVWDTASGTCILTVPAGNSQFAVAFSPDGHRLAVGMSPGFGFPGGVNVYDLENGHGLRTVRGLEQRIEKIAISADSRRAAALSNNWEVVVFETGSGALHGVAEAPEGYFTDNAALALNADGTRLVCSGGSEARLWDVQAKRLIRSWKLPPALTEAAGFRSDGRLILIRQETQGRVLAPSAGVPSKIHPRVCRAYELPELGDPKTMAEIADFDTYVEHIAASPDAAHFAVQGLRSRDGKPERILIVYDGATGKPVGSIPTAMPATDAGTGMRFDPTGSRLKVLRDPREDAPYELFELPGLRLAGSVIDASTIGVGGSRWVTHLSQTVDTPEMVLLNEHGRPGPLLRIVRDVGMSGAEGIKFTPDGNHILWGNQDGTVTVCDLNEVQRRLASVGLGW